MKNDRSFLQRALEIAEKGILKGHGPFGAVITKEGRILAETANEVVISNDPTAHAEILAIRRASSLLGTHDLSGCVLYTSCEPCPMCLGAIYWSGINKVIYASDRNDAERSGFSDRLIYDEITLDPSERKISFIKLNGPGGKKIFKKWDDFESKIPY